MQISQRNDFVEKVLIFLKNKTFEKTKKAKWKKKIKKIIAIENEIFLLKEKPKIQKLECEKNEKYSLFIWLKIACCVGEEMLKGREEFIKCIGMIEIRRICLTSIKARVEEAQDMHFMLVKIEVCWKSWKPNFKFLISNKLHIIG